MGSTVGDASVALRRPVLASIAEMTARWLASSGRFAAPIRAKVPAIAPAHRPMIAPKSLPPSR